MSEKNKPPNFAVGAAGKREVKRVLLRSTNPASTITNFQQTRSLHSMFARAFGTTPCYARETRSNESPVESLDTDSVMKFLNHLGVSQYEVHKRIADSLQRQLESEIRKIGKNDNEPLLNLLKNCWHHATTVPELRPILWAVLKKLGEDTPLAVLKALGEREAPDSKHLKHIEIFRPLPPLLKRLVWEADWEDKVPVQKELTVNNPKEYLKLVHSTLLHETAQPLIEKYCSTEALLESAGKFFVTSVLERRVLTTQRRALAHTSTTASSSMSTATTTSILGKTLAGGSTQTPSSSSSEPLLTSGKAVSQLRQLLGDAVGGTASYRPKLLHAFLSLLMAHHGSQAPKVLTGPHLHCTLVADILLSSGGPLPKVYTHVHTLARVLDDAVKAGVFTNKDLIKVQATLRSIYEAEQTEDGDSAKLKEMEAKKKEKAARDKASDQKKKPTTFLKRQLNRIITAGIQAMKESDPQNLFLNPVTDAIAPGYSKVIKKPMSIGNMESKIENHVYDSIDDWNADVKLMFKNCADYNRGQAGQWFRGEAGRQLKVFKDEILPQAKRLYQAEVKKRNPEEDDWKKKRVEEQKGPEITALEPATKKRKLSENQDYTLSMPGLASMLLADPFVVRLLLDRVLRSLRIDVLKGSNIPALHTVIPSLLQLLHMARWSTQICALRGTRYLVPDSGVVPPEGIEALEAMIPYDSLRRFLPVLLHLLMEAELDKRVTSGGDLHPIANTLERPEPPTINLGGESPPYQVVVALVEGAYVHVCVPGNSQEASLSATFRKFGSILQSLLGPVWEERSFFVSLVPTILRHKVRLNRTTRDTIIDTWLGWLSLPEVHGAKKKKKKGSMMSAAHEHLVKLLGEWAGFGNLLLPRDLLLKVLTRIVNTVNATEINEERKFASVWKDTTTVDFEPIKNLYQRLLNNLPESHRLEWKESVGIGEPKEESKAVDDGDAMDVDSKEADS